MIGGNEFPLNSFGRAGRTCSTPQCNLWFLLGFLIHCILLGSIPIAFQMPPEVWCFRYVFVVEIPPHPGVLKPRVCNNRFSSRSWNPWKPSQPGSLVVFTVWVPRFGTGKFIAHISAIPKPKPGHGCSNINQPISWQINGRIGKSFQHDRLMTGPRIVHLV